MKKVTQLTAAALLASSVSIAVPAFAEVSVNVGATSNYVWRGVSQSANGAAVSGGIDYESESGFYAGTWISNTSFGTSEHDLYLGYGFDLGEGSATIGFIEYVYPTIDDSNFGEIHFDYEIAGFSAGVALTVVSDIDLGLFAEDDLYYYIGYGADLGNDWSLGLTFGSYDFDQDGNVGIGDISYSYFQIDLGKSVGEFGDLTFSLSIADEESTEDDPITFVSWSKGF